MIVGSGGVAAATAVTNAQTSQGLGATPSGWSPPPSTRTYIWAASAS